MQKIFAKCLYFTKKTELSQTDTDFNQLKRQAPIDSSKQLQAISVWCDWWIILSGYILTLSEVSLLVILWKYCAKTSVCDHQKTVTQCRVIKSVCWVQQFVSSYSDNYGTLFSGTLRLLSVIYPNQRLFVTIVHFLWYCPTIRNVIICN